LHWPTELLAKSAWRSRCPVAALGWPRASLVVRNYQRAITAEIHRERADNYRTGKKGKSDPGRAPGPP